jgi:hypothetical protein
MSNLPLPTQTPNVVIENPKARKIVRTALDIVGATAFIVAAADAASSAFDLTEITTPVLAAYGVARSVFGFLVDNPNTPGA